MVVVAFTVVVVGLTVVVSLVVVVVGFVVVVVVLVVVVVVAFVVVVVTTGASIAVYSSLYLVANFAASESLGAYILAEDIVSLVPIISVFMPLTYSSLRPEFSKA